LWAAPILLLVIGGTAAGFVIARKSRLPAEDSIEDSRDPQARNTSGGA